jgi:hypothetical protein
MARNGSGQFDLLVNSWNPAINGTLATAGDWQALINDVAAAITQSVSRDGQTPMTGNLDLANNKITGVTAGAGTGEALAFQQLFNQGTQQDIASAATTDIGIQNTNFLRVTGTTTITSFGANYRGPRFLVFAGAVTLTNSSTLVLPGGANITTAAGDVLIAIPGATLGTADKWIVTAYQRNTNPSSSTFTSVATDSLTVNGNNISASGGFSFKNRLINANPIINQRVYVSGTATSGANQYTLDRWRVVTSGQNVSWTDSGLTRTLTCPAGGLEQVIESLNIEGGTFVLNWTGTATATVNGTAVLKNGTFTLPANTNATVRFSSGTLSEPQLEAGSVATPFERRDYGRELMMCQRYAVQLVEGTPQVVVTGQCFTADTGGGVLRFPVEMRAAPTITASSASHFSMAIANGAQAAVSGTNFNSISNRGFLCEFTGRSGGGLSAGNATTILSNNSAARLLASAEL